MTARSELDAWLNDTEWVNEPDDYAWHDSMRWRDEDCVDAMPVAPDYFVPAVWLVDVPVAPDYFVPAL